MIPSPINPQNAILGNAVSTQTPIPGQGYGVTTCAPATIAPSLTIVDDIEAYLNSYVSFADTCHTLPIALWLAATHTWPTFDAFPYLVVTSTTKRSGKTRRMESMSFVAANARAVAHISPAAMFHTIHAEKPTLFVDEAEVFSSPNSEFRPLLNTGYRRGQKVLRQNGGGTVEYDTYWQESHYDHMQRVVQRILAGRTE